LPWNETVPIEGSLLNVEGPRVYIQTGEAAGRTAEELADELAAEIPEGFPIQRTTLTLDGQPAVVLSNLPGQDLHRTVIVVHGGRLYQFMFVPVGEDYGELAVLTEKLCGAVINLLQFRGWRGLLVGWLVGLATRKSGYYLSESCDPVMHRLS
jgi:hypothetical protein